MRDLQIIHGLDIGITAVFGVEALLKIIAFTFVAYFRVNSNKVGKLSCCSRAVCMRLVACSYDTLLW